MPAGELTGRQDRPVTTGRLRQLGRGMPLLQPVHSDGRLSTGFHRLFITRRRHLSFFHSSPCPRLSASRHAASSSGGILFDK